MSAELLPVPFYDDQLLAMRDELGVWAALRPIAEALGLDFSAQRQRLKRQPWTCMVVITTQVSGQRRRVVCLRSDRLAMWLATISVGRVRPELRAKLARYQIEAAEVLDRHFRGAPPSPRPPRRAEQLGLFDAARELAGIREELAGLRAELRQGPAQRPRAAGHRPAPVRAELLERVRAHLAEHPAEVLTVAELLGPLDVVGSRAAEMEIGGALRALGYQRERHLQCGVRRYYYVQAGSATAWARAWGRA